MTLGQWKDIVAFFDSALKDLAIILGGVGSYYLFWRKRQIYPRAQVVLSVEQHRLARRKLLVRVRATLQNRGEVLIHLSQGYANLCLVAPCDRRFNNEMDERVSPTDTTLHEVVAPLITKLRFSPNEQCEIEPGESEPIFFDFVVDRDQYRLLRVDVHFCNAAKKKRPIGWSEQLIFEVQCPRRHDEQKGDQNGGSRRSRTAEKGDRGGGEKSSASEEV